MSPSLDQAYAAIQKNDDTTRGILSQEQAEEAPVIASAMKDSQTPKPKPPDLQKVPQAPQSDFGSDAQEWVTAMTLLSGVVGAFSRQHASTALNAFSAGIQGFRQGKQDAIDQSFKQWDESTKAAIENNKILQDKYKDVLDDRKLTFDDQMNQIQLIAAQYKDMLTYQAAAEKNYTLVAKIIESQQMAGERASAASERLELQRENFELKKSQSETSLTPEAIGLAAQQLAAGDASALTNVGRGTQGAANLAAIRNAVAQIPGMTGDKLASIDLKMKGLQSEARTLGTQTAKLQSAGREADNLGDLLIAASKKVPRGKIPSLNAALLAGERGTGDPDVVAYGAALNSFINAYSRAINPNGVGTVKDKDHAREMLSEGFSQGQVESVVAQLKKETQQAREAPEFVRNQMQGEVGSNKAMGSLVDDTGNPASAFPSGGGGKENPVKVTTQTDFDALPSGAWFENPADGKILQKK